MIGLRAARAILVLLKLKRTSLDPQYNNRDELKAFDANVFSFGTVALSLLEVATYNIRIVEMSLLL